MKKSKISPLKTNQNDKILIDEDEFTDNSHVEPLCNQCHTNTLVTITDQAGNSNLFCKRCSVVFDPQDDTVRHKQRLSVPQENEIAISTTPTIGADAVAIRHESEIKGGLKALQQKGLKITNYKEDIPKPKRK